MRPSAEFELLERRTYDLIEAISNSDYEGAKEIIAHDVNIVFREGLLIKSAAIDHIARNGDIALFNYVLSNLHNPERILTYCDGMGFGIPAMAITFNQEFFVDYLLAVLSAEQVNMMFENPSSKATPLKTSIISAKKSIAEALIKHKIDLASIDSYGFNPVQLAILDGGYDQLLAENGIAAADKIESIRKIVTACAFLEFSYSEHGFYTRQDWVVKMYAELGASVVEESDRKFLDALRIMQSKELVDISEDKKIKVLAINYLQHVAYMVITCDSLGVPKEISYCDSYIPFSDSAEKYQNGEYRFVAKSKFKNVEDLEREIVALLDTESAEIYLNPERLAEKFANFACCDDKGELVIVAKKIPMQKQSGTRTNCAFKSVDMAMRTIASIMYPEMTYELSPETSMSSGTLHNDYKCFKAKTIDAAIETLCNFLLQGHKVVGDDYHDEYVLALRHCELAFAKANSKWDFMQGLKLNEVLTEVYSRCSQDFPSAEMEPAQAVMAGAQANTETTRS